jgi:hypothetical protein
MPIFIKENQELKDKMFKLPQNVLNHLNTTLSTYGQYKDKDGYKRLNTLLNPNYNKRSDKEDKIADDGKHISFSDLKRINFDFDKMPKNPNDLSFILNGGDVMKDWVQNTLRRARNSVKPTLKSKKQHTIDKNAVMPTKSPTKPIKMDDNSTIHIHEENYNDNKIINEEYHPYYERLSDYDEYYVFDAFKSNENIWLPLINPKMYHQALSEFTRFGYFMSFPTKYIYQWIGIIMKNTAILRAMTAIAGHDMYFPLDTFIDVFFNDDIDSWNEYKEKIGEDSDYGAAWEYFEEIGYDEWQSLPDGTDAISDFGIEPIEKLISKYNSNMSPEDTIVLINKILDITHMRGDLSSIFIVGGKKSLHNITYRQNESKTITESSNTFITFINQLGEKKKYDSIKHIYRPLVGLTEYVNTAMGKKVVTNNDINTLLQTYNIKPLQDSRGMSYFKNNKGNKFPAYSLNTFIEKVMISVNGKYQLNNKSVDIIKNNRNIIKKSQTNDDKFKEFHDNVKRYNPEDYKEPTAYEREMNNESVNNKKIFIKENQLLNLTKNKNIIINYL